MCTIKIEGVGTAVGYGVSKVMAHEDGLTEMIIKRGFSYEKECSDKK